jgi:hypothetical protein
MEGLHRDLRNRFLSGDWDPLKCTSADIKRRFDERRGDFQQRKITIQDFDCLYRRAACETITETWKQTRTQERHGVCATAESAVLSREGLFSC